MTKLSIEQRRALTLLAGVGPMGATQALMLAHGFNIEMLVELVDDELASATPESTRARGQAMQITRLRITDVGRQALGV
jgi:hypothetical protein